MNVTPELAAMLVQTRHVLVCLWLSLALIVAIDTLFDPRRLRRKIIISIIAEIIIGIQIAIEVVVLGIEAGSLVSIFILSCMIIYTVITIRKRRKRNERYFNSDRVL